MRHIGIIVFGLSVIVVLSVAAYIGDLAIARYSELQSDLDDRLQVVMRAAEGGSAMREMEFKSIKTEHVVSTKKDVATTMIFKKGDAMTRIISELGTPVEKEIVGDVEVLKYNGCNVVCKNGYVIGWFIK